MSTTETTKFPLPYYINEIINVSTGEKTKRAFPLVNDVIAMDRFCDKMSGDYGRMAGKPSHVKGMICGMMDNILEELEQGNAVSLGEYLKFTPTLRGPVDPETGKPNENTTVGISITPLKKMKLSIENFTLVNRDGESVEPKFTAVYACSLNAAKDVIVKGESFQILGRNIYFDAETGDTVTVGFAEGGEATSITVTPTECNPGAMKFAFPAALAEVADGTELEITLRTHRGVKDSAVSMTSRKAVLAGNK